ncbi:uncharacterized protein FA14DRAFT_23139 [Meira miltonrushii]|uniref:Anaphase-promoting complex subunit 5 n=1 Tax=Meira miltonrushii TaxID=1280837 RepID=A0A316VLH2_9BASI|nr:uncharacterized protein FA14DRAFT_23139 [Meira miltonrushii]PWN38114.1 hypothetical protein FA14DRAFT_23139 [Meira miltonrushii]
METAYTQPWPGGLSGIEIAICALIHFYVQHEPLNETGPLLTRLLSFTIRLIFRVDPYANDLTTFNNQLRAYLKGNTDKFDDESSSRSIDAIIQSITDCIDEATTFSGLHTFFSRIERLLMREEMYDELQNMTIRPAERQIDESSPFGYFIHRCLETYLSLEDDEFGKIVEKIEAWVVNDQVDAQFTVSLNLSSEEEVALAMRKGDYATARALLEGSFDRPPAAMLGRSLPETLLYNAVFHVKTKAYDTARDSLREALRLARGVNDTRAIASCDDLLRQIEFEERKARPRPKLRTMDSDMNIEGESKTIKHKRDAYQQIEDANPLLGVLQGIEDLQKQARKRITGLGDDGLDDPNVCEYDLLQSNIWQLIGSEGNAKAMQNVNRDDSATITNWTAKEYALSHALSQAKGEAMNGRVSKALGILIEPELIKTMDINMLQNWHSEMLRIVYQAAKRSGSEATASKIERLRPELKYATGYAGHSQSSSEVRHASDPFRPNEASFGQQVRTSKEEDLSNLLFEAVQMRLISNEPSKALSTSMQVIHEAGRSNLFTLHRRGVVEASESLLALGQVQQAQDLLDEIMARTLVDQDIEARADVSWTYSRAILARKSDEAYKESFSWLNRAIEGYRSAQMWPKLKEVLYVKARIAHHLNDSEQRDEAAQEYNFITEECSKIDEEESEILEKLQDVAALVSARTASGG